MKLMQIIRRVLLVISSIFSYLGAFRKHHVSEDKGNETHNNKGGSI